MNQLLVVVEKTTPFEEVERQTQNFIQTWPLALRPKIKMVAVEDFAEMAEQYPSSVYWLYLPDADFSAIDTALSTVYEHMCPALISVTEDASDYIGDGIMALPATAGAQAVSVSLQTLFTQAATLRLLRVEEKALRIQQASTARHINQIDEELRLASQLQKQFVPQEKELPQNIGFNFQCLWRAAGYVSGDIYDVKRLDEEHVGVFVADAIGHGVPAALMAMYIKRSLNTKVLDSNYESGYRLMEPAQAIAQLNRDLYNQNMPGQTRFATACYALINIKTRVVRFARAGHPYPMLLRANGETEFIQAEGGLLGIFDDDHHNFEQTEFTLETGDRLLIYSDGFEVAFPNPNDKTLANEDYLKHFEMMRADDIENAFQKLTDMVDNHAGSLNQRDDLTLICCAAAEPGAEQTQDRQASNSESSPNKAAA